MNNLIFKIPYFSQKGRYNDQVNSPKIWLLLNQLYILGLCMGTICVHTILQNKNTSDLL